MFNKYFKSIFLIPRNWILLHDYDIYITLRVALRVEYFLTIWCKYYIPDYGLLFPSCPTEICCSHLCLGLSDHQHRKMLNSNFHPLNAHSSKQLFQLMNLFVSLLTIRKLSWKYVFLQLSSIITSVKTVGRTIFRILSKIYDQKKSYRGVLYKRCP